MDSVINNRKPKYKLIDLFAGAGGLSNGFIQTGKFEVLGAVEINKSAAKTYVENHNKNEDLIIKSGNSGMSDVSKIDFANFILEKKTSGDEIVVIGGPPCQGFSNANRQKNYLISGNNQLVKQYVRAIDEIKPTAFLLENVRSMKSDVHKFFVTEHIEDTIYSYSSLKHLKQITKNSKEGLNRLIKDDTITLVETKYSFLKDIFEGIYHQEELDPIIENKIYISRLRSIERKTNKLQSIKLLTTKEKNETTQLIEYLENKVEKDPLIKQLKIDVIISSAITILKLVVKQEVDKENIINTIGPLMDLNTFLLHYKELIEEKIIFLKPLDIKQMKEKVSVIAKVKSYNIVEYLKTVFTFYDYKIDDNVLDASFFGVPQRRKRFMVLGVRKDKVKVNKVKLPTQLNCIMTPYTVFDAISDLEKISPQKELKNYIPSSYIKGKKLSPLQSYFRKYNNRIYNHISTNSRDLSLKRFEAIKKDGGKNFHSLSDDLKTTYTNSERTQNTIYLRLNYHEPSPTVVNVRKSMWNHPKNAVALSIREAARLQSFRDGYIFYGTKDQQYQQVGNAVPPLLARGVSEQLLNIIGEKALITIEEEFSEKQ
ncbi:site-specific DNA-methyltransferase (cytosine-specific) [Oceanobacillus iheyensis HTE831]|uniref:DNA (cytosine-5-)-methyltransferase n=1 Tax=Oceanobacillus iheyensis (strain DSM 14371 / CIP 107618 / JCM 11309 / KCTC 3954 / HTE831) TaxID=221109 RepID=Q8CXP0_OCEIH|nr:DNA cytosine methyltransferase [Oceanobacillus iheyensis]BAC12129.1 site-specific DNA-methyltransferase (cytosine-specific) [Oceanobacillus iheyensis HTE831]